MVDPKITDYIKNAREKDSLTDEAIKQNLRSVGWDDKEIEEAFQIVDSLGPKEEKPAIEVPRERGPTEEFLKEEGFIEKPKRFQFSKKYLAPLIVLVVFIFLVSASVFVYSKFFRKIDPISLLPQETSFYLRMKIDPNDKQVKNLKENLNKFPYYEKLSQKISEEFEKMKKENPPLRNLDFTISDELILAWISPFEPGKEIKEIPLVIIIPDPNLKKLEKLAKDVQSEIEKSKDWKLETETYKKRTIYKAVPTQESIYQTYPGEPKLEPSTTFTNGHFVLASKPEDIKKIIDVAEDQKITNIFKKDKVKNINSNTAYKKIKKYLPKNYLASFYGEFDWSKILKTAEISETVKETEKILPPLTASLKAALNLPFFKGKEIEEPEKMAFAGIIIAEKNEIKIENYSLDLRKDAFLPSQFSFKDSLAGFLPEKIGNREIAYYTEGRNLKSSFEYSEKTFAKEMEPEVKRNYEELLEKLKETIGVDLKEDIISLFDKNYAILVASEPTGKETPAISLIFEIDDENKAKENLLKIKVPKIPTIEESLEQSRLRAKDARIMADMAQIRTWAEIIYTDKGSYKYVYCNYNSEVKSICDDIKKQIGSWPITRQSRDKYCAYTKLNEPGIYYCIEGPPKYTRGRTSINPGGKNYCTGKTFICPKTGGTPLPEIIPPEEKASFSKETIDGFEIYSLPVYGNLGLNFSTKDKKLISTFTKEGLVNVLKSLADPNQKKLKDSQIFAEQFKEIPKEITRISYSYPYGFLGVAKYTVNFISGLYYAPLISEMVPTEAMPPVEDIVAPSFEFLDKGIAPYLKVLKFASGYSYSPEKGLNIDKSKLVFEDLSPEEKKATEEFWTNIGKWFEENFIRPIEQLYPPPIPLD